MRRLELIKNHFQGVDEKISRSDDAKLMEEVLLPGEIPTALELLEFKDTGDMESQFSHDYLGITKVPNIVLDMDVVRKALEFLYTRHQCFRAHFVLEAGKVKRKYFELSEDNEGRIPIEISYLNISSSSPEIDNYIQSKAVSSNLTNKHGHRWHFIKALDCVLVMFYAHDAFMDVGVLEQICFNEFLHFHKKVVNNRSITFEEANKELPKVNKYEDVIRKFYKIQNDSHDNYIKFLTPVFEKLNIADSILWKTSKNPKANKMILHIPESHPTVTFLNDRGIRPNQAIMTLFQIALHLFFKPNTQTLPFYKFNGFRPEFAKGVLCSYVKEQIFANELKPENTLAQQYQDNYNWNRDMLKRFCEIDSVAPLRELEAKLKKDCQPKIMYNYIAVNHRSAEYDTQPDFSDNYDVICNRFCLYYELSFNDKQKMYKGSFWYKQDMFDPELMARVNLFLATCFDNLPNLLKTQVKDLTEEYVFSLPRALKVESYKGKDMLAKL